MCEIKTVKQYTTINNLNYNTLYLLKGSNFYGVSWNEHFLNGFKGWTKKRFPHLQKVYDITLSKTMQ